MQWYEIAMLGGVGGVIPDLLRVIGERHTGLAPSYLKTWFFWLSLILLAGLGAGTAYVAFAYAGVPSSFTTALAIGYGTPSVISKLLGDASATIEAFRRREALRGMAPHLDPASRSPEASRKATLMEGVPQAEGLRDWWAR
jgi:hypothetical protein